MRNPMTKNKDNKVVWLGSNEYPWKNPPLNYDDEFDPRAEDWSRLASEVVKSKEPFENLKARAEAWQSAYDKAKNGALH